jgi:hypothetical protein
MKTITDDQRQLIHAVIAEGLTNLPGQGARPDPADV